MSALAAKQNSSSATPKEHKHMCEAPRVARGCTARYLGCQVGADISPGQLFAQVLMSIRKKLHWSSRRLDLASRALVANQILLA